MTTRPVIKVQNAQRKVRVALIELQKFCERALPLCLGERAPAPSHLAALPLVCAVIISDRRMAELHKKFMQILGPTDVLTFQHGEIFVSVETAQQNARHFRTTTMSELLLYIIHGLLHLHGFDDTTPEKARAMKSTQSRILSAAQSE